MRRERRRVVSCLGGGLALCLLLSSCTPAGGAGPGDAPGDGSPDGGGDTPTPSARCRPGEGISGRPTTIAEAVALMNSLPRPTTVACFLESLERPLKLAASSSILSAQPAVGLRSPRLFLFSGGLTMSVVPEGRGGEVVEFAESRPGGLSVKAELAFPLTAHVPPEAPYEKVMFRADLTSCALCHVGEQPDAKVGSAQSYASIAFRPTRADRVTLGQVREAAQGCDAAAEPERCAFYTALFGHGTVEAQDFPETMPTFVPE